MDKEEILVPILTAINDLRGEVRENRTEIMKNREAILENRFMIKENKNLIQKNRKSIISIEEILKRHEDERRKDRTDLLGILCKYEQVTDGQYKENKRRIEKIEKRLKMDNLTNLLQNGKI